MRIDKIAMAYRSPRRSRRAANSLIEVLGSMSVLLILGLSAASILGKITDVGLTSNEARLGQVSIERLADAFRQDARVADRWTPDQRDTSVQFSVGSKSIRYSWQESPEVILRQVTENETVVSVERFRLPSRCRPSCSTTDEKRIALQLTAPGQPNPWTIEATKP